MTSPVTLDALTTNQSHTEVGPNLVNFAAPFSVLLNGDSALHKDTNTQTTRDHDLHLRSFSFQDSKS